MMRKPFFCITIFIIALLVLPHVSFAKNGWVSDMLVLTFRQGPGNNFAVEKALTSNTPVTILDEQNGYYKVELQSKETGWVDKKFIIFEQPKAILLAQAKQQNVSLENRIKRQSDEIQALKDKIADQDTAYSGQLTPLQSNLKASQAENKSLNRELLQAREKYNTLIKQSKNIQEIVTENKRLQEDNKVLMAELKEIKSKNRNMFKTAMIKWFLAGVGVLLLGWIIGQSVSSKRHGYGSLLD